MASVETIRRVTLQALEELGFSYRQQAGGVLRARIPPEHRHRFPAQDELRLVFDPDLWGQDRSLHLVMPGSGILDTLEEALRAEGAGRAIQVGGALLPDEDLPQRWSAAMRVINADLQEAEPRVHHKQLLKMVYEVRLPGPPPTVEVVPVVWDWARRRVLTPPEVAKLHRQTWYDLTEVQALLEAPPSWPSKATLEAALAGAKAELQKRIGPLVHGAQSDRQEEIEEELERLEHDRSLRLDAAEDAEERAAIHEEFERRSRILKSMADLEVKATLVATSLMLVGRPQLRVRYQHRRNGKARSWTPLVLPDGRIDGRYCTTCREQRQEYLLLDEESPGPLACTTCTQACADAACTGTIQRSHTPACRHCGEHRLCAKHIQTCAHCCTDSCSDHGQPAACCGRWICTEHLRQDTLKPRTICVAHARQCSIDHAWYHHSDVVTCAVTGRVVAKRNAITIEGDERLLHPDAVVRCHSTQRPVARDRAVACARDQKLHHPEEMATCARTGRHLCPAHRETLDLPPGLVVDSRRVFTCAETGEKIDQHDTRRCSVSDQLYHRGRVITCPVTSRTLHPSKVVKVPGDDRLLHPDAVVRCRASGQLVARDRAVVDQLNVGHLLHPNSAFRCELSGKITGRDYRVHLLCCGRAVARNMPDRSRLIGFPGGRVACTDHYGLCAEGDHPAPLAQMSRCATTKKLVCAEHRQTCSCHGQQHLASTLRLTPYAPSTRYCQSMPWVDGCPRCGLGAPRAPDSDICVACSQPVKLDLAPPDVRHQFDVEVRPRLPWYMVRLQTVVTGNASVRMFSLQTLTGQLQRYRIGPGAQVARQLNAGPWEELP